MLPPLTGCFISWLCDECEAWKEAKFSFVQSWWLTIYRSGVIGNYPWNHVVSMLPNKLMSKRCWAFSGWRFIVKQTLENGVERPTGPQSFFFSKHWNQNKSLEDCVLLPLSKRWLFINISDILVFTSCNF